MALKSADRNRNACSFLFVKINRTLFTGFFYRFEEFILKKLKLCCSWSVLVFRVKIGYSRLLFRVCRLHSRLIPIPSFGAAYIQWSCVVTLNDWFEAVSQGQTYLNSYQSDLLPNVSSVQQTYLNSYQSDLLFSCSFHCHWCKKKKKKKWNYKLWSDVAHLVMALCKFIRINK